MYVVHSLLGSECVNMKKVMGTKAQSTMMTGAKSNCRMDKTTKSSSVIEYPDHRTNLGMSEAVIP